MVVSLQIMDGRNDEANNQYGLKNREHSNRDDVMSIKNNGHATKKKTKRKKMKLTVLTRGAVLTGQTTRILEKCWTYQE